MIIARALMRLPSSRWTAQRVCYSGARSGLAPGQVRFANEHIPSLRCPVHGGRKSCRAGTDDHQVPDVRPINRVVESKTVCDLLVARIPQHRVAIADQHWHVGGSHMKPIEEILRISVAIEVDVMKRVAIARQELLDAQRAGAMRRANQNDVTIATGDQLDAAENERPHEDLAQLGVRLDESEQLFPSELDRLARRDGPNPRQTSATSQHGAFAGELPSAKSGEQRFGYPRCSEHLDLALRHHEEWH